MAVFRILHASDFHIAAKPKLVGIMDLPQAGVYKVGRTRRASSHHPDLLDALAAYAFNHRDELDAIVLSGDLATTGKRADLKAAHAFVNSTPTDRWLYGESPDLLKAGRPTMHGANRPVFLLPGNHDRFKGPLFGPGGTRFDKIFRVYWACGQSAQPLRILKKAGRQLALVGADFTLRKRRDAKGACGHWGQGRVDPCVVGTLAEITGRIREQEPAVGIIWIVHFPPAYRDMPQGLALLDGELVVKKAMSLGITVMLAGHLHKALDYVPEGVVGDLHTFVAGTASQYIAPDGNVIHIIDVNVNVDGETLANRVDLRWDDATQSFA